MSFTLSKTLSKIDYSKIIRIDLALEGNWNDTCKTVWKRKDGVLPSIKITLKHQHFKPSLELYFKSEWVGIHCYNRVNGFNYYNKKKALEIIKYVEKK